MKKFTMDEANRGELAKRDLSAKARYVIDNTDPCGIFEVEKDGKKKYYITGVIKTSGTLEEIEKDLEEYYAIEMQFEASPDGNILWGEDDEVKIVATIEVPEGASEDYGYMTMKKAILAAFPDRRFVFWYDDQEHLLEEDANADVHVDLDVEYK